MNDLYDENEFFKAGHMAYGVCTTTIGIYT